MKTLRSPSRGDENALHLGALGILVGATPGRRGLPTLSRPTARRPIGGPGDRTFRRTPLTSESPAARARILARCPTPFRLGGQASGPYSSRRAGHPLSG